MAVARDAYGVHPVLACARHVSDEVGAIADVPVELMGADDKAAALVAISATADRLEALRLRLLASADDVAAECGARDAGAWLAHEVRADRSEQQRALRLGVALAERWQAVATALAAGTVNLAQARVIAHALDELPGDVPADVVSGAQAQLVAYAAEFGPRDLRILGRRILDVVAPEVAEAAEARALEAEERRAAESTTLSLTPYGDGTTRVRGQLPDATAHRLATYLDAFTSPRRSEDRAVVPGPIERRRGRAFCALLEHLDPDQLPVHGGDATTVMVTMTLDQLRSDLATAGLISGDDHRITAAEARRLACTAGIVPVVLGGASEVLDLGRTSRLFSRAQRKALRVRDRRCRARGCSIPATWCEAHHLKPWARGGATDLADGVLLCSFHHHRAHDPAVDVRRCPDGELELRRARPTDRGSVVRGGQGGAA
ncbi:HNH endonuclease signature motif containing protein [Nocardioides pocheonensis]|uniref:HNH endonuclease n=1 Tax=Nocardioides pocheonensis TaxID=661485 RepID=A0A3N0GW03_9ACTN|nr:HNH endonuclease signature motif containing protein [Nocardioides pocheonensis]RNM16318.1 HNH endonuclease [Nocardioides pocheonensis]